MPLGRRIAACSTGHAADRGWPVCMHACMCTCILLVRVHGACSRQRGCHGAGGSSRRRSSRCLRRCWAAEPIRLVHAPSGACSIAIPMCAPCWTPPIRDLARVVQETSLPFDTTEVQDFQVSGRSGTAALCAHYHIYYVFCCMHAASGANTQRLRCTKCCRQPSTPSLSRTRLRALMQSVPQHF